MAENAKSKNVASGQKPAESKPPDFVLEPDGEFAVFCLVDGHLFQPMRWKTKSGHPAGNFFAIYDAYGQPTLAAFCKDHRAVFDRTKLVTFLKPKEVVEKALNDPSRKFDAPRFQMREPKEKQTSAKPKQ